MKEWKRIKGYERYSISSEGEIMNPQGKLMKPFPVGAGYLQVSLWKDCKRKKFYVHRLVAEAFCENPCSYKEVNHKDGNKKNNCIENLEWCTRAENLNHSYYTLQNHVKAVKCLDTGAVYPSIKEAARQTGLNHTAISMCCDGRRKKTHGFHWGYAT